MTVVENELDRLWALLSELSAQLSHNRHQTEELHRRAEELKVRGVRRNSPLLALTLYRSCRLRRSILKRASRYGGSTWMLPRVRAWELD